jgi:hypothetical protein
MEKITGEQDHVDVTLLGERHDFVETLPAVVPADRIPLVVPDMIVCRDENPDGIGLWIMSV